MPRDTWPVRSVPTDIVLEHLVQAIAQHWEVTVTALDYHPEGGGAYHWVGSRARGPEFFVTVDDLDTKPWLGAHRTAVFEGLSSSYATAVELSRSTHLPFVISPVPAESGAPCVRLTERHALALFPFVAGEPGHWGEPLAAFGRAELVGLLAELHRSSPASGLTLHRAGPVPGRAQLEEVLGETDRTWEGGPLSELARLELAKSVHRVTGWLSELDILAAGVAETEQTTVITHGEPHPGNLIRATDRVVLVDWDTAALGPPERDLWMLDEDAWARYGRLTGHSVEARTVRAYRLTWALSDVASFVTQLRQPHDANADTKRALVALGRLFELREPAPYGIPLL